MKQPPARQAHPAVSSVQHMQLHTFLLWYWYFFLCYVLSTDSQAFPAGIQKISLFILTSF